MQGQALANGTESNTDWHAIDWQSANRVVRNLRQRIFRATQEGNWKKVHSLQKLMLRSRSNALVSVRRVTQTNAGRNTPGVDKLVVKTPTARGQLVDEILSHTPWRAKPARRVYIPKANGKRRPLGIPVVKDRALQAMVKNALEPCWEAQFEGSSYGFRPGRGAHDAIGKIFLLASPHRKKKWVVDADIKGAFDNISHDHLLKAIGAFSGRELIKQWLKAGYVEMGHYHDTESGTPQGGVISPLLANIALHGMEQALGMKFNYRGEIVGKRAVVRYADDFVVFCETQEDAEKAKGILAEWLKERGLELSEEKTRIAHLSEGFDFLGFNIRHYRAPKTSATGWKLLIRPSKESVKKIRAKLREEWRSLHGHSVDAVIQRLNPIIRGWGNYHRHVVSSKVFSSLDNWMFTREVLYAKRTHQNKPKKWWQAKYFGKFNQQREAKWVFGSKNTGKYVFQFSWLKIERHVIVKGVASADDPSLRDYWLKRQQSRITELFPNRQTLAKHQNGLCPHCGETLFNEEVMELHHVDGNHSNNGRDNLQLVHYYCHQQITQQNRKRDKIE